LLEFPLDGTVSFSITDGEVKIRVDSPKKVKKARKKK
jgi:hypothetical protein